MKLVDIANRIGVYTKNLKHENGMPLSLQEALAAIRCVQDRMEAHVRYHHIQSIESECLKSEKKEDARLKRWRKNTSIPLPKPEMGKPLREVKNK